MSTKKTTDEQSMTCMKEETYPIHLCKVVFGVAMAGDPKDPSSADTQTNLMPTSLSLSLSLAYLDYRPTQVVLQ